MILGSTAHLHPSRSATNETYVSLAVDCAESVTYLAENRMGSDRFMHRFKPSDPRAGSRVKTPWLVVILSLAGCSRTTGEAPPSLPPKPTFALRVYAKEIPEKSRRLLGALPLSKGIVVGSLADVQLFAMPSPAQGLTLIVESKGTQRTLRSQLDGSGGDDETAVGTVFTAGSLGAGDVEICGVLVQSGHVGIGTSLGELAASSVAVAPVQCGTLTVSP